MSQSHKLLHKLKGNNKKKNTLWTKNRYKVIDLKSKNLKINYSRTGTDLLADAAIRASSQFGIKNLNDQLN